MVTIFVQNMFNIRPLELAANVFLAETAEDLDRFYGLDTMPPPKTGINASYLNIINVALPPELSSRCKSAIVELDVVRQGVSGSSPSLEEGSTSGGISVKKIPSGCKEILLCDDLDEIAGPIKSGQIVIVSPNHGIPRAFFKPIGEQKDQQQNAFVREIGESQSDMIVD